MKIFGLTGSIGSGKSTVAGMIQALGVPVICADEMARRVVEPGKPALQSIISRFGQNILLPDGTLDRRKLGALVFADPLQRQILNAIVHPEVRTEMMLQMDRYRQQGEKAVVLDIPLLFESGWEDFCDETIVVYSPEPLMKERILSRDALSDAEITGRISAQISIEEKKRRANHVIDNQGTLDQTQKQVESLFQRLLK